MGNLTDKVRRLDVAAGRDATAKDEEHGIKRRHVEFAVAALLFGLAGLVMSDSLRIGAGWGGTGPQSGYFPMRVGSIVGLCGVVAFIQAWRDASSELFVTWTQLKRVAQLAIPLAAYVAIIGPLGIYVASTIFIAAFMLFAGGYPAWKAVVLAALTNLLMFYIFEIQFKVPLPKGPLEAWFGY